MNIKDITVERLRYAAQVHVDRKTFGGLLEPSAIVDEETRILAIRLVAYVNSSRRTERDKVSIPGGPKSWWQHVKQALYWSDWYVWAFGGWEPFGPVQYHVPYNVAQTINVYHVCPHLPVQDTRPEAHFMYLAENQDD